MARNRDPFSTALASLRERIGSGALGSGSPVIVADEAERLNLSTTPVREALAHLNGEGLVARTGARGYVTVRMDRLQAQDQYALRSLYLRGALEHGHPGLQGAARPVLDPETPAASVKRLFDWLVHNAGNDQLERAYERLSVQTAPLVRAEAVLFSDLAEEAEHLFQTYDAGPPTGFAAPIVAYHQRRLDAASVLASLVIDGRPPIPPEDA